MSEELIERLRQELAGARRELRDARARIAAMEESRFWKLRNAWWRVKSRLSGHAEPGLAAPLPEEPLPPDDFEALFHAEVALPPDARVLEGERLRAAAESERAAILAEGRARRARRRVLFVLPVAERGGGANVVFSEARAMRAMGVDACVLNVPRLRASFERSYRGNDVPVLWAAPERIPEVAAQFDAAIATANGSVAWLAPLSGSGTAIGYYVQDYEPWFFAEGSAEFDAARASYTLVPDMRLFTKTEWNRDVVKRETGAEAAVVGCSFDGEAFSPRFPAPPDAPFRVAAMIRPSSPRRGPDRTMRVFAELKAELGDAVQLFTFGVDGREPAYRRLAHFPHHHLGVLDEARLATLLSRVHVFADFSDYQAMGLTALEAMACGATAIVPEAGGARSFARDGGNALVIDTESERACADALRRLARDVDLRKRLMCAAPRVLAEHLPERAALKSLEALFGDVSPRV